MTTSNPGTHRELDSRVAAGIHVRLLWRADDGHLVVAVTDSKRDEEFCVAVRDRARALDVFHHPFAYPVHHGVQADGIWPDDRVSASVSA